MSRCEQCGKAFERYQPQQRFCSWSCYAVPVALTCEHCGAAFARYRSQAGPYCSRDCADAAHYSRGERLTTEQIAAILASTERDTQIARRFGVAHSTVWRLRRGKTHRDKTS